MKSVLHNRILKVSILVLVIVFFLLRQYKSTTTGNVPADQEIQEQSAERPETGELDF